MQEAGLAMLGDDDDCSASLEADCVVDIVADDYEVDSAISIWSNMNQVNRSASKSSSLA